MSDKGWKQAERRMAKDVGSRRKPCDGSRDGADFEDGLCAYQLKVRKVIPRWLWTWLAGIRFTARFQGKLGCLVLKHPGQKDADALVILTWADWVLLHGDAQREVTGGIRTTGFDRSSAGESRDNPTGTRPAEK